jgi:hypothetical protein
MLLRLGGELGAVYQFPGGAVAEQPLDERGVHGVAGALGDDAAPDAAAGQSEIADEVQNFVADELVGETQRAVFDALAGEDDRRFGGGAADETHVAQHGLIFAEAEGARGSDE